MAILESEVFIGLAGGNIKYFENLGYDIPRVKDNWGRFQVPKGTKILVKVTDLPERSHTKLTKICDECGKTNPNKQPYDAILNSRTQGDGKDRCFECGLKWSGIIRKNNISYENSFEYWAIENNKVHLLEEFSDTNIKKPNQISYGNNDQYIWDCNKCGGQYPARLSNRVMLDRNCPYCAGKRVLIGFNDLWTTHEKIALLLTNSNVGYMVTGGSGKFVDFTCPICNYINNKRVTDVVRYGVRCSRCSDGIPYPEKIMFSLLLQLGLEFESQKIFDWSKNVKSKNKNLCGLKKYDFYIPHLNMIIETHGGQHYEKGFVGGRSLTDEQENDYIKEQLAINNGIENFIIIDSRYSTLEWMKRKIIESTLCEFFDLTRIDWEKSHQYACNSLVKEVCDFWNSGVKSTLKISDLMNLHFSTVTVYLKQGAEIGWCDYDAEEVRIKTLNSNKKKLSRKIAQLSLDGELLKEWDSMAEASNCLNISSSTISKVCNGKFKQTGGYRWVYLDNNKVNKRKSNALSKPVVKINIENDYIEVFESLTNASETLGINVGNIGEVCKGKRKKAGGFKWMYKDDYDKLQQEINVYN